MLQPRDLPLVAVFATVARCGSFTAAARELGLAKSVVSDNVRALEQRCAVRLLERTSRRLRLTQVGERLLDTAVSIAAAPAAIDALLDEHRDTVIGTLRVATTSDLGPRLVIPVAARLGAVHSQLRIDVVSDDRIQDLVAGGFDIGVRLGVPRDSAYVMRKLRVVGELVVGTPALADAWPVARARALTGAPWVKHAMVGGDVWSLRGPRGEQDQVVVAVRAQANTGEGVRALVLGGLGFAVLPDYLVADDLARGTLVDICPGWRAKDVTLYAVLPSAGRPPRRVALFLDGLRAASA